jgi:glyoxalase family protein
MESLNGLHHVTAITGDAAGNVRFYTGVLGLRLVKKTVNQDDVSAYHLFYADGKGSPGTDVTFFDWPAAPANRRGVPEIAPIALSVPPGSLTWWAQRFSAQDVDHMAPDDGGQARLSFSDPEGQRLELVEDRGPYAGEPWPGSDVPTEHQVRGLHGVRLASARPQLTVEVLAVMGYEHAGRQQSTEGEEHSFIVPHAGAGREIRLLVPNERGVARQGRGGVHHAAFRVSGDEAQEEWRQRIAGVGLMPTPVIDRFYFKSVYFREPGGNLFEIATDGPGFTADEPLDDLGVRLALPPFLEPRREQIEAGLAPIAI